MREIAGCGRSGRWALRRGGHQRAARRAPWLLGAVAASGGGRQGRAAPAARGAPACRCRNRCARGAGGGGRRAAGGGRRAQRAPPPPWQLFARPGNTTGGVSLVPALARPAQRRRERERGWKGEGLRGRRNQREAGVGRRGRKLSFNRWPELGQSTPKRQLENPPPPQQLTRMGAAAHATRSSRVACRTSQSI